MVNIPQGQFGRTYNSADIDCLALGKKLEHLASQQSDFSLYWENQASDNQCQTNVHRPECVKLKSGKYEWDMLLTRINKQHTIFNTFTDVNAITLIFVVTQYNMSLNCIDVDPTAFIVVIA